VQDVPGKNQNHTVLPNTFLSPSFSYVLHFVLGQVMNSPVLSLKKKKNYLAASYPMTSGIWIVQLNIYA